MAVSGGFVVGMDLLFGSPDPKGHANMFLVSSFKSASPRKSLFALGHVAQKLQKCLLCFLFSCRLFSNLFVLVLLRYNCFQLLLI